LKPSPPSRFIVGIELVATTVAVCFAIAVVALMYGSLFSSRLPFWMQFGWLYVTLFGIVTPYWPLQPRLNGLVAILLWVLQWSLVSALVGRLVEGRERRQSISIAIVTVLVVGIIVNATLRWLGYRLVTN
jgi:hypothetical protein